MIARSAATAIALCLMAGAAHATCGVGGYWGSECGPVTQPGDTTNTAGAIAGAVGIGTGIGVGYGGNSTSTATGGTGGRAVATGGQGGRGGSATAGVNGSGNSTNRVQQGQQQGQTQQASANNRINIDNRTRQSAAQAAPVILGGYGPANCFGDTNPSGQFGASMQLFGWGVTANSSKASNVCAAYAIGGPAMAIGYLQRMDPNMPRRVTVEQPTGRVTCPATHPVYVEGKGCRK